MEINEEVVSTEEEVNYPYVIYIRFEGTKKAYTFGSFHNDYEPGTKVVVETVRGLEIGETIGYPKTKEELSLRADLPQDMQELIQKLENNN